MLSWLPHGGFPIFEHAFAPHGRDYGIVVQDMMGCESVRRLRLPGAATAGNAPGMRPCRCLGIFR